MSAWVFIAGCGVIFYTGFCRMVHTDHTTVLCIRVVFWALTVSAASGIAAVLVWSYAPGWPSAALVVCMAALQVATSVLWREGVPRQYQTPRAHWWTR